MPAYRCQACDINYPPEVGFRVCPNCDAKIDYFTELQFDREWRKLIEMKRAGMEFPSRIPGRQETDAATVIFDNMKDRVMVSHRDLTRLGFDDAEPFDVIKMNGTYYELLDFIADSKFWVIERINVYDWLDQIDKEFGEPFEGPSSDDITQVNVDGMTVYMRKPYEP